MKRVTVGLAVAGAIVLASQAGAFVRSNSPAIGDKAGNTTKTTSLAEILRSRQMSELSAKGLYAGIDDNTPTPRIFWADRSNPKRFRASGDRQAQALSYLKHYADAL